MSDVVISVEGLGKKYRIRHQGAPKYVALRDVVVDKFTTPIRWIRDKRKSGNGSQPPGLLPQVPTPASREDFWALKDVFFEVKQGEVVGIIGRNGAGKSTLLKILSRITEPTVGRVQLEGRVSSLLEVGTGFHPELTGRENIFLNGAILGMTRAEIKKKFDEIVAFAEVERFLDTPVKWYSSGMYVRLAFAVAAHLEPEILIVDEVLAVGDAAFQKKCLGKMSEVAKQGRTVLFVSHNMGVISTLTQRCIYMQGGQISAVGSSRDMVEMYLSRSLESDLTVVADLDSYRRARVDDSPVTIVRIGLKGHDVSCGIPTIEVGAKFTIEIDLCVLRKLHDANVTVIVKTSQGERVVVLVSWDRNYVLAVEPGRHVVTACISDLPLAPGHYFADIGIDPSMTALAYDSILDYPLLAVANTGQVTHWLERPWGALHCSSVDWNTARFEGS